MPFSFAFQLVVFATEYVQNTRKTTLGPYGLVSVELAPVYSAWWPFCNKVYIQANSLSWSFSFTGVLYWYDDK